MKHTLLYVVLSFPLIGSAQKATFSIDQLNAAVFVSITIHSGNFCNGIQILRSDDSLNFETVGTIQGYCGNLSESITYNFTDQYPIVNQKSYYKAELVGLTTTEVRSILVLDLGTDDYSLTANPVSSMTTLYFKNPLQKDVTLTLFNLYGQSIYQENGTSDYFHIDATGYQNGIYVFLIKDVEGSELATGKIIVEK